jgi:cyclopropane fatty-acyl-phospholipid synthase-like methyltransferase
MEIKYYHNENSHHISSPKILTEMIYEKFKPDSVLDFGCGYGVFLNCFKKLGVKEVLGLDGFWVQKQEINKYLNRDEFLEVNLEEKIELKKKFDLVISLEVAEHINEDKSDIFIENLIKHGDVIIFSAGIPHQPGIKHVNCQWVNYWEKKFNNKGFKVIDYFRPKIWDNDEIVWWYRQNLVLVVPENFNIEDIKALNLVHPENYLNFCNSRQDLKKIYNDILNANKSPIFFLKLFIKSIFKKIRF